MDCSEDSANMAGISDLPEEVQEHILSMLSPYRDLRSCMNVCKLWHELTKGIIVQKYQSFNKSLETLDVEWMPLVPEAGPTISDRHSHSSCYFDKSMYVFGGCTSTSTTFNDLWRLDLATRQWIRPLAIGTYPSPKACASMVVYRNSLVLFGGWSHPTPYPLHQAARFFSELHVYTPSSNRWNHVFTRGCPPPTAGHSASIVGDTMIVFGGSHGHGASSGDLWSLDLKEMLWSKHEIPGHRKPRPRYGQSQVVLDDNNILILGGCGGPNMQYNDVWLLSMNTSPWQWKEIQAHEEENRPPKLWCHPACKVGNKLVLVSRLKKQPVTQAVLSQQTNSDIRTRTSKLWIPPTENKDNPTQNVEKHGVGGVGVPGSSSTRSSAIRASVQGPSAQGSSVQGPSAQGGAPAPGASILTIPRILKKTGKPVKHPMHLYVLDISTVLTEGCVTWQPIREDVDSDAPEETIFYSIVEGRGELIVFGGIQTDLNTMSNRGYSSEPQIVTNHVYFIGSKKFMI
ncbi:unnamed protein product [Owenia fusiformis]|uniref:Uncharacterized protein n=1 Tax=Owenia fusiformis TaxID=6347 RepID=A0A8J1UBZ3_OWEFU|nr:unnamed protein product [Owenia fusiformis]